MVDNMQNGNMIEKLENVFIKLNEFPDLFKMNVQTNKEVRNYFATNFDCMNLPEDFVKFMEMYDGLHCEIFTIFSMWSYLEQFTMNYKDYANEETIQDYVRQLKINGNYRLMFFAADNMGGRYAFKKDVPDQKVYYFNAQQPEVVVMYESFVDLLYDKVVSCIEKMV